MDEARRVLERLERIEALRGEAAPPRELLEELRGLLRDGHAWLAAEGAGGAERADSALDALGNALARAGGPVGPAWKEVVATEGTPQSGR
jgi:hypothetical protein